MTLGDGPRDGSPSAAEAVKKLYRNLKERLSSHDFETWFRRTPCRFESPNTFVFKTVNNFRKAWIEKRYSNLLHDAAREICSADPHLLFEVENAETAARPKPDLAGPQRWLESAGTPVFPASSSSFAGFLVGPESKVAYAAATAVAELPGRSYNPLCIYGASGTGKTHLLHAVALFLQETSNLSQVQTTAEAFSNQYMHAVQARDLESFRARFRSTDVLLMDDVHFFADKPKTQAEFFHTFTSLLADHKQVVLTSLEAPQEIHGFQEQIAARLRWGLVARIEPPCESTRLQFALQKAEEKDFAIPFETAAVLSKRGGQTLRELEGALNRLVSVCRFYRTAPTPHVADQILRDMFSEADSCLAGAVTIDSIVKALSEYYGIKESDLLSRSKVRAFVFARQMGMYLARKLTPLSLNQVGLQFGGRDHTTVLYSQRRIASLMECSAQVQSDYQTLKSRLLSLR